MKVDLSGKVAVVTGGGGLLCSCFSEELARNGASIAVLDLNEEAARATADKINGNGGRAIAVACNVLEYDSVKAAEERVRAEFGQYHILINGAGGSPAWASTEETAAPGDTECTFAQKQALFNLPAESMAKVMDINFLGSYITTQVFSAHMMNVPGACIINMSSMSALSPLSKQPAYSTSKAALTSFTLWCAKYLADVGIRVNAIAPGFFATNINRHLLFDAQGNLTKRSEKIIAGTPMNRFGQPEELLGALLFLCDETASGFVTGAVIPVDGGFSAYCGV
ncbi:MAG: SDR family oxidoreductase [Oscillospiraceae bacterium]|nr:SDR family oxidoreductase [Oscillospiraceae bacterium]